MSRFPNLLNLKIFQRDHHRFFFSFLFPFAKAIETVQVALKELDTFIEATYNELLGELINDEVNNAISDQALAQVGVFCFFS